MNNMEIPPLEYSYVFNFERDFNEKNARKWMNNNWTISLYFVAIYLVLVLGGPHLMKSRPRFKLRGILIFWNTMLAAFSIMGACRTIPSFIYTLRYYGLYYSLCLPTIIEEDRVSTFWGWMFILSKLPELVDTIFIVLRKRPLIFLHWYHHITVLLFTWFCYSETGLQTRWLLVMNYIVHSLMYSYYALRSRGYSLSKSLAMFITILQITQMFGGCFVSTWAYFNLIYGESDCNLTPLIAKLALGMYLSYLFLFIHYFIKAYSAPSTERKKLVPEATSTDYHLHKSKVD